MTDEISTPKWLIDLDVVPPEPEATEPELDSYLGSTPNQISSAEQSEAGTTPSSFIEKPVRSTPRVRVKPDVPELTKKPGAALQIHQLWQGTVMEVEGESFTAVLSDKTQSGAPDEVVEFANFELSEDDRPLVTPGSVFYWMIGTKQTPSGQVDNISTIQFSRLPVWTRSSLNAASEEASRTQQWFLQDANQPAKL